MALGRITPFLWFDDQAEEAAEWYTSIFDDSEVLEVSRYGEAGPGPAGSAMAVRFRLEGLEFTALNGGPAHYGFTEAVSFVVTCRSQAEVDRYWEALTDGGEEVACGWLKDRYGLSWQVVPTRLFELLADPDAGRRERATQAMLHMKKLDTAVMEAAADAAEELPAAP